MGDAELEGSCGKAKLFNLDGLEMWAKCVKVYDGDTIHLNFRFHGEIMRFKCRMKMYNSAEMRTGDPAEKAAAIVARDYISSLILNRIVRVRVGPYDKYGRLLVDLWVVPSGGGGEISVNGAMIEGGYGVRYEGKGEKKWKV